MHPLTHLVVFPCILQICQAAAISTSSTLSIFRRDQTSETFSSTWRNPVNSLPVLLIIGAAVIQKALAQLSGPRFVPVAFSFGWVAYSFGTLASIVGDGRLMPPPDYPAKVINAANGYTRGNKSWVLGRLLRDFEHPLNDDVGLCITVFEAGGENREAGVPSRDWCWASGPIVIALQCAIAAIPVGLHRDWGILFLTVSGTALALMTGILPQWRFEKWACRRNSDKVVSLTAGNGTRHVMVIIGGKKGLDLEDLAASESPIMRRRMEESGRWSQTVIDEGNAERRSRMIEDLPVAFRITQIVCLTLALLWIVFLITVTSLQQNTWYLLAVGGIGMIQNVFVAGARRHQSTSGIHLETVEHFRQQKVMDALMDLESAYERVGRSLVPEFLPSRRPDEEQWWAGEKDEYDRQRVKNRPHTVSSQEVPVRALDARQRHKMSLVRQV